jgi:hypothetical protein
LQGIGFGQSLFLLKMVNIPPEVRAIHHWLVFDANSFGKELYKTATKTVGAFAYDWGCENVSVYFLHFLAAFARLNCNHLHNYKIVTFYCRCDLNYF